MSKSSKATDTPGWPRHTDLRSTHLFRMLNFELYAKPNKLIMTAGVTCLAGAVAYILYMRKQSDTAGDHSILIDDHHREMTRKNVSKWDT